MNHPRGKYQRAVRDGVKARGGDLEYVENILKRELECINDLPFEEMVKANPRRFYKYFATTPRQKETLEMLPNSLYEHAYIGNYLMGYTDENGLLDEDLIQEDLINLGFARKKEIFIKVSDFITNELGKKPDLAIDKELNEYFKCAKETYVCESTKTIVVYFEFREMYYLPSWAVFRLDSWKNRKYRIQDEIVLEKQLKKIEEFEKNLNLSVTPTPTEFVKWLNSPISDKNIGELTLLYSSISIDSPQYFKETFENIINSGDYEEYKDYLVYAVHVTADPFNDNCEYTFEVARKLSFDFANDARYREIYD